MSFWNQKCNYLWHAKYIGNLKFFFFDFKAIFYLIFIVDETNSGWYFMFLIVFAVIILIFVILWIW